MTLWQCSVCKNTAEWHLFTLSWITLDFFFCGVSDFTYCKYAPLVALDELMYSQGCAEIPADFLPLVCSYQNILFHFYSVWCPLFLFFLLLFVQAFCLHTVPSVLLQSNHCVFTLPCFCLCRCVNICVCAFFFADSLINVEMF